MRIIIHESCYVDAWIIHRIIRERSHLSYHHIVSSIVKIHFTVSLLYKNSGLLCKSVVKFAWRERLFAEEGKSIGTLTGVFINSSNELNRLTIN